MARADDSRNYVFYKMNIDIIHYDQNGRISGYQEWYDFQKTWLLCRSMYLNELAVGYMENHVSQKTIYFIR